MKPIDKKTLIASKAVGSLASATAVSPRPSLGFFYFMIAILFSFEQKGFHIETMKEYLLSNYRVTEIQKDHQLRLVAIAKDWEDADKVCDELSKIKPFKQYLPC